MQRGLDHGAWVPLSLIYPAADIPVLKLSVQPHLGPGHHLHLGRLLARLREDGVLIIGSGSFTHDLLEFRGHSLNDGGPNWVNAFADWFDAALHERRFADLVDYRQPAPYALKNHPNEEHLLPLYVATARASKRQPPPQRQPNCRRLQERRSFRRSQGTLRTGEQRREHQGIAEIGGAPGERRQVDQRHAAHQGGRNARQRRDEDE